MTIEIKVPQLPESVTDATLVAWHKKSGDAVSRDENLVDLETDKVVLEVPAPASGSLVEIRVENGATVTAGDVLAILEEGEAAAAELIRVTESKPDRLDGWTELANAKPDGYFIGGFDLPQIGRRSSVWYPGWPFFLTIGCKTT